MSFVSVDPADVGEEIDAAYRTKYRRYPAGIVNSVLTPAGARRDARTRAQRSMTQSEKEGRSRAGRC